MKEKKSVQKNLRVIAYETLKRKLVHCEYAPGSILNEAQLAVELNASRTPVREAISILEREGYLLVIPKKGILVTEISLNDARQIFQTRLEIEPVALRMAASNFDKVELLDWYQKFERISKDYFADKQVFTEGVSAEYYPGYQLDKEMHLYLIKQCKNSYIIEMMQKVYDKNTRIIVTSSQNRVHLQQAHEEHLAILKALLEEDVEKAIDLLRGHISNCRKAAFNYFYMT